MSAPQAGDASALPGPLHGLRVLELADEKGQFCGKLMADLGADVIKIEPPGGQYTRLVGPFLDDIPHRERSLSFWHYNTSKRGITLNLEHLEGQDLLRRLVPTADILLETYPPGYLPGLGLAYDVLSSLNPRLIVCSLTPFGQTGPWRDFLSADLLQLAAGGQMSCCGYDPQDVPDAPPIAPGGGNAWHIGSHFAYMAILAAVYYRDMTGEGQYIDASIHEACALTTEAAGTTYIYTGKVVQRHTGRAASLDQSEPTQFQTQDGLWVNTTRTGFNLTPGGCSVWRRCWISTAWRKICWTRSIRILPLFRPICGTLVRCWSIFLRMCRKKMPGAPGRKTGSPGAEYARWTRSSTISICTTAASSRKSSTRNSDAVSSTLVGRRSTTVLPGASPGVPRSSASTTKRFSAENLGCRKPS